MRLCNQEAKFKPLAVQLPLVLNLNQRAQFKGRCSKNELIPRACQRSFQHAKCFKRDEKQQEQSQHLQIGVLREMCV